jgi:hypothetical protein
MSARMRLLRLLLTASTLVAGVVPLAHAQVPAVSAGAPAAPASLGGVLGDEDEANEGVPGLDLSDDEIFEHDEALEAVENHRALPLSDLIAIVAGYTKDRIIDVRLVLFRETLIYEVKTLGGNGVVSDLYFYAATGELVGQEFLNARSGGGG